MKDSRQSTVTHTIDLGYEQLLILEDGSGRHVAVLFRGVWLSCRTDRHGHVSSGVEAEAPQAGIRSILGLLAAARIAFNEPARSRWFRRLDAPIHV
jgi:hypothetical protein